MHDFTFFRSNSECCFTISLWTLRHYSVNTPSFISGHIIVKLWAWVQITKITTSSSSSSSSWPTCIDNCHVSNECCTSTICRASSSSSHPSPTGATTRSDSEAATSVGCLPSSSVARCRRVAVAVRSTTSMRVVRSPLPTVSWIRRFDERWLDGLATLIARTLHPHATETTTHINSKTTRNGRQFCMENMNFTMNAKIPTVIIVLLIMKKHYAAMLWHES